MSELRNKFLEVYNEYLALVGSIQRTDVGVFLTNEGIRMDGYVGSILDKGPDGFPSEIPFGHVVINYDNKAPRDMEFLCYFDDKPPGMPNTADIDKDSIHLNESGVLYFERHGGISYYEIDIDGGQMVIVFPGELDSPVLHEEINDFRKRVFPDDVLLDPSQPHDALITIDYANLFDHETGQRLGPPTRGQHLTLGSTIQSDDTRKLTSQLKEITVRLAPRDEVRKTGHTIKMGDDEVQVKLGVGFLGPNRVGLRYDEHTEEYILTINSQDTVAIDATQQDHTVSLWCAEDAGLLFPFHSGQLKLPNSRFAALNQRINLQDETADLGRNLRERVITIKNIPDQLIDPDLALTMAPYVVRLAATYVNTIENKQDNIFRVVTYLIDEAEKLDGVPIPDVFYRLRELEPKILEVFYEIRDHPEGLAIDHEMTALETALRTTHASTEFLKSALRGYIYPALEEMQKDAIDPHVYSKFLSACKDTINEALALLEEFEREFPDLTNDLQLETFITNFLENYDRNSELTPEQLVNDIKAHLYEMLTGTHLIARELFDYIGQGEKEFRVNVSDHMFIKDVVEGIDGIGKNISRIQDSAFEAIDKKFSNPDVAKRLEALIDQFQNPGREM